MSRADNREMLATSNCRAQSHGGSQSSSVNVVLPKTGREILGIDPQTTLWIYAFADRIAIADERRPELADRAIIDDRQGIYQEKSSLRLCIPFPIRQIFDIKPKDVLSIRMYETHLEYARVRDTLEHGDRA